MKMMRLRLLPGLMALLASALPVLAQLPMSLHTFTNAPDGSGPENLVLSNGVLYGATQNGGSNYNGTVFSVTTNGGSYAKIHDFGGESLDGAAPNEITVNGATLYGSTRFGGTNGYDSGTLFKMDLAGNNYSLLRSYTNSDGANPSGGLI